MSLDEIKESVAMAEPELAKRPFVVVNTAERDGRKIHVALTDKLRRSCKRGRVWKSRGFLAALKNAQYGYEGTRARSAGGVDGIFLLSREYRPRNAMMRKIFDRFLDKHGSGAAEIADALGSSVDSLVPVRLVSHHMRLLGVLHRIDEDDTLVLIDYDDTK